IGHAILRRHPITGAVQRGNSVTHSVADATLRIIAGSLKTERPVSFHGLLMCMREFAARRAKMDAILRKNHMADAAARAAPKINTKKLLQDAPAWAASAPRSSSLPSFGSTSSTAFALAAPPPAPVPSVFGIIGQAAAAVATRFSFRLSALRG